MEVRILILKHRNGLYYDDNHNGLLASLICLPGMVVVSPTQDGNPKTESYVASNP